MARTPQQQSFVEALRDSTSNIALEAVAGSGKTYTLVEGANELQLAGTAVAFNKRNAEELQKRMPSSIECKTMNATGHRAWMKQVGSGMSVDAGKIRGITQRMWSYQERQRTPGLDRFIDLMRLHEVVPDGAPYQGKPNRHSADYLQDLFDRYDLGGDEEIDMFVYFDRAKQALNESIKMAWNKQIDFVDQLYMPIVYNAPFTPSNFLMVDEVQDLSPIQHKIIRRMARGRTVAAGDPAQAIYGFAGAMSGSMEAMLRDFSMEVMPLTWCFRCPEEVIRVAQKYNPKILPAPGAEKGVVDYVEGLEKVRMGDVVLSYRNAALLEAAFNLIARGIGAKLYGSGDLAQQLLKLATKFSFPRDNFLRQLRDWRDKKVSDLIAAGKESQANATADRATCLSIIVMRGKCENAYGLEAEIRTIFGMDGSTAPVICSTIHKFKGMEADRVHIYRFEDLFKGSHFMSPEEMQQRRNMAYVQITRARKELYFVKPKEGDSENE